MPALPLSKRLKAKARALGFEACAITGPDSIPEAPKRLATWLSSGAAGTMDWMGESAERRGNPKVLWPQVRSIIMLGMNYGPESDPRAALDNRQSGTISVYARHRDYHGVIKGRLKTLAGWLMSQAGEGEVKVFVDTAPVMEKPLAEAAGLGWQGRHTNLVSREFGSWLLLGSIFTTLELTPDTRERDHCGSCRACMDACPTAAFPAPYQIDARRCISYLTIEHKGHIGAEFRKAMGNRIYGCDDCLAACPWNKFAQAGHEAKLQARADLNAPPLADLLALDDKGFRDHFAGGPIKRIGHARFIRNVLIAAGNSCDPALVGPVKNRLKDPSPLARAMAIWSLRQLVGPEEFDRLRGEYALGEKDEAVLGEWDMPAPAPGQKSD